MGNQTTGIAVRTYPTYLVPAGLLGSAGGQPAPVGVAVPPDAQGLSSGSDSSGEGGGLSKWGLRRARLLCAWTRGRHGGARCEIWKPIIWALAGDATKNPAVAMWPKKRRMDAQGKIEASKSMRTVRARNRNDKPTWLGEAPKKALRLPSPRS